MPVCDTRSALQSATAPLHAEIDALFGAFDLAERDGLTRFLVAQAIAMQACQPRASRFALEQLGMQAPDYRAMLLQDLRTLGIAADRLPQFELGADLADAGIFYVVAGSRMGAAVLRERAVAPTPAGPARTACAYFARGNGPAIWRRFREWLAGEALRASPDLAALTEAAMATFRLFARAAEWVAAQPALPALAASLAPLSSDHPVPAMAAGAAPAVPPGFAALVVEDNMLIALDAEEVLREFGADKVRLCRNVAGAIDSLASASFDVALLDVNLGDETSEAVAVALRACGTSFIVTTGFGDFVGDLEAYAGAPILTKPYAAAALSRALADIMD